MRRLAPLCAFLLATQGCLPIPWDRTISPGMTGTVREQGAGLAAVAVHLGHANPQGTDCTAPLVTRTDAAGHFAG